eukprot:14945977-Alexandrium_andersonii.AAC.1
MGILEVAGLAEGEERRTGGCRHGWRQRALGGEAAAGAGDGQMKPPPADVWSRHGRNVERQKK